METRTYTGSCWRTPTQLSQSTPRTAPQAPLLLSCVYTSMYLRRLLWGRAETEGGMNGIRGSIFLNSSDVAEGEGE